MKQIFFLISLLFAPNFIFGQSFSLQGQLADSKTKEYLSNANIILENTVNNKKSGTLSDRSGRFTFTGLKSGTYRMEIGYLGYSSYKKEIQIKNQSVDLEIIYLEQSAIQTRQVEVIDKLIPAVQKQDTTEYNSGAFKTNLDANAEELVNKIPGVTTQDGKIQVQGEEVKNVLVDGRVFFGNDPSAVLRNLPAEVVEKIQVFDKQSEQAEFTGFDDGNTSKTLNLITRLRSREGTFGKAAAGYGNQEKYLGLGNLNFFKGTRRISLLGNMNNVNEQNFSNEDLLGVMSEGGGMRRGFRRQPGEGREQGHGMETGGGPLRGGDQSGFLVNTKDGITTTGAFALNYSDRWNDRLEFTGSYFFNSADNNSISSINRDFFISTGSDQNYSEKNISNSINRNHRINVRVDYKMDSLSSILFMPRISVQDNIGNNDNKGSSFTGTEILNNIAHIYDSDQRAVDASGTLLYRKRFKTRGRTFSLNLGGSYKKTKGENTLYSESIYYNESLYSDTLDQLYNINRNGNSSSAVFMYTEPLGENSQLMFNGDLSRSYEFSDQRTFYDDLLNKTYSSTDTSLSSIYDKIYQVINFGTGYRYQHKDFFISSGISFNKSTLQKEQSLPFISGDSKHFYSILPSVMLRYNISPDKNLRINYRSSNKEPAIEQLQFVLDNSNPQQLSIGNPDLIQDYRHLFNIRYTSINTAAMSSFFVLLNAIFTNNYIGYNTFIAARDTLNYKSIVINPGVQLRTPVNIDNYFNLRSMLAYGVPLSLLKSNLNLNLNIGYSNTPALINGSTNEARTSSAGLGIVIGSNFSNDLDFTISTNLNYNILNNTLQKNNNNEYYTQRARVRLYAAVWQGIFIQTEFNQQYDEGLSKQYDPDSYLLNLSIGKKLFAKDQGEIRLTAFDVFNKSSNIRRTVTDTYWEDTSTNVIGNYIILAFTYNLRAF